MRPNRAIAGILLAVALVLGGSAVAARGAGPASARASAGPATGPAPADTAARRTSADLTTGAASAGTATGPASADAAPASPGASPAAASLPLAGVTIAVDPGHNGGNGSHPAAAGRLIWIGTTWKPCNKAGTATRGGYPEHRFNWLVANRVKAQLEALGATVRMTRASDAGVGPCISTRGRFGARVHAALELSIHADGSLPGNRGFFVMRPRVIPGWTDDIAGSSKRLAVAVRRGLVGVGLPIANYYAKNGLIARGDLGTLNFSDVPVVEVELGNMKNARDAARMRSVAGRDRYARGLVAGIRRFLGK